ncbi:MAG TPA: flagellar FlbD family protein [Acidimicrobiales bacterium]|nr:flagellar FlbD family protein [Acidimicrobiales bacterium]
MRRPGSEGIAPSVQERAERDDRKVCRPKDGPGAKALMPDGAGLMILLTRLNGPQIAVNADLIERAEATPDTVLTLVDGTKYLVTESVQEVIDRVRNFRASVLVAAKELEDSASQPRATLRALPDPTEG